MTESTVQTAEPMSEPSPKHRFNIEEMVREAAQSSTTISLPRFVVETFVAAANGERTPTIEEWALAARLTAAELTKAAEQIRRLDADAANERAEKESWKRIACDRNVVIGTLGEEVERLRRQLEAALTPVCYSPCGKHMGQPWTTTVGWSPPPKVICPICEPPGPPCS